MEKLDTEQLITLTQMNLDVPFAMECLQTLISPNPRGYSVGPGIREHVIRANTIRARNDKKRGGLIIGFELLLINLNEAHTDDVKVNVIRFGDRNLLVFCDKDFQVLFGILSAPAPPGKEHFYLDG